MGRWSCPVCKDGLRLVRRCSDEHYTAMGRSCRVWSIWPPLPNPPYPTAPNFPEADTSTERMEHCSLGQVGKDKILSIVMIWEEQQRPGFLQSNTPVCDILGQIFLMEAPLSV